VPCTEIEQLFALTGAVLNTTATRFGVGKHIWNFDYKNIPIGVKVSFKSHIFTLQKTFILLSKKPVTKECVPPCKASLKLTAEAWIHLPDNLRPSGHSMQAIDLPFVSSYLSEQEGSILLLLLHRAGCRDWHWEHNRDNIPMPVSSNLSLGLIALEVRLILNRPIHSYWDFQEPGKKCLDQKTLMLVTGSINTLSDLLVFLWPGPRIWTVQMPVKRRLGLIFIFCLGCV
jgi:hypothetical protein